MEDVRLVVDTSVIRAAGDREGNRSRAALEAIRGSGHSVVRSHALGAEWQKHLLMSSQYSRTWVLNMHQRNRIDEIGDTTDEDLRARLRAAYPNQRDRWPAMDKDAHLLEAALGRGMRVIALDQRIQGHFRGALHTAPECARILWANPDIDVERTPGWIADGTPREAARQLDPTA